MDQIQAILWDMDGVLVDTTELHFLTWARVFSQHHIPFSREKFQFIYGMNNRQAIAILGGEHLTDDFKDALSEQKETLFRQMLCEKELLLPGVKTWLEYFRSNGFAQAIASSAPRENIDAIVHSLGLRPFFDTTVSASALPSKPEPHVFLEAASLVGIPPGRCVVIEDTPAGIEGARRAGMRCIGVATTNPPNALRAANLVLHRLSDLTPKEAVERLNNN